VARGPFGIEHTRRCLLTRRSANGGVVAGLEEEGGLGSIGTGGAVFPGKYFENYPGLGRTPNSYVAELGRSAPTGGPGMLRWGRDGAHAN